MDQTVALFWSNSSWKIPGTTWEIIGYSRSSYRTGFYIKALDLMIDSGPQKSGNPSTFLITHCHGDHIANLPFTLIGKNKNENGAYDKPNIFVPRESQEHLNEYIKSMFTVNNCQKFDETIVNYYPLEGCEIFEDYSAGKTKITIRVFKCDHDIPTVCYGLSINKKILKEEYRDKDSKTLASIAKEGHELSKIKLEHKIIFVWDTSISVLENNPEIFDYPVIMIECTFLFDEDYEQSLTKKHIHWNSLKPYILEHDKTFFVLTHFSLKYKENEISQFFEKLHIPNVKPWITIF